MRTPNFSSNKKVIVLCLSVKSIVFVNVLLLLGNLTFIVVTVLAIFNTLSTFKLILLDLSILPNSLYILYATKQMQTCVSIRFGCKVKHWTYFKRSLGYSIGSFNDPKTTVFSLTFINNLDTNNATSFFCVQTLNKRIIFSCSRVLKKSWEFLNSNF